MNRITENSAVVQFIKLGIYFSENEYFTYAKSRFRYSSNKCKE